MERHFFFDFLNQERVNKEIDVKQKVAAMLIAQYQLKSNMLSMFLGSLTGACLHMQLLDAPTKSAVTIDFNCASISEDPFYRYLSLKIVERQV